MSQSASSRPNSHPEDVSPNEGQPNKRSPRADRSPPGAVPPAAAPPSTVPPAASAAKGRVLQGGATRAVGTSTSAPPPVAAPVVPPPSDDKRWRIVNATMRKNGFAANSLIETLHTAQETFGFLSDPALLYVARSLHLPPSRVYGVATFYNLFHLQPQGEHSCVVCLGTACYIKGAAQIVSALESSTGVSLGETTPDGRVSLLAARCLGACGLAPACVFDGEVMGKLESAAAVSRLEEWTQDAA